MVAGLLHLPTATWGGRMGLYLLSTLVLSGSTPFGNMIIYISSCPAMRQPVFARGPNSQAKGSVPYRNGDCEIYGSRDTMARRHTEPRARA